MKIFSLCFLLITTALGLSIYKVKVLDIPVRPDPSYRAWAVETVVKVKVKGKRSRVSMYLPSSSSKGEVLNENFISDGYGLSKINSDSGRRLDWITSKSKGAHSLRYQVLIKPVIKAKPVKVKNTNFKYKLSKAQLEAAKKIIKNSRRIVRDNKYKDRLSQLIKEIVKIVKNKEETEQDYSAILKKIDSSRAEARYVASILSLAGYPSRIAHGVKLNKTVSNAKLKHWIEVSVSGFWKAYNVEENQFGVPDSYFKWWVGDSSLIDSSKSTKIINQNISIVKQENLNLNSAISKAGKKSRALGSLTLTKLPYQTQAIYRLMLLIPIGALGVAFLRNVIGIKTFGTFMPVLIALAFREVSLLWGLVLFTLVITIGLIARLVLEKLQLLLVPRLTAILTTVILIMASTALFSHYNGFSHGMSLSLFPVVILTMTIERMSVLWEETGFLAAVKTAFGSMLVASLVYFIITNEYLNYFVFVFPEILLINLAFAILLGRYTGYRLLELTRFKALATGEL